MSTILGISIYLTFETSITKLEFNFKCNKCFFIGRKQGFNQTSKLISKTKFNE